MEKKDKKHIAFNTHLIVWFVLFLVLVSILIAFVIEKDIMAVVFCSVLILIFMFVFIISPLYVIFSDEGVEIVYNFGQREFIKWSKIKEISLKGSWITKGGGPPSYVISYRSKEKLPFFAMGEIPKTLKTKRLLKKYYKREIT